jgi:adenosine/AMP kinase
MNIEIKKVEIKTPEECNLILGQSHFIKTVEDLHEIMVETVPEIKFGLAFCESSGPCLVRKSGNDEKLEKLAAKTAFDLSAGHCFVIFIKNAYPINILNKIKNLSEVCNIYCATANPVQTIIAETEQGRGILGVVDGSKSKGIETEKDIKERKEFLRKIGYKLS